MIPKDQDLIQIVATSIILLSLLYSAFRNYGIRQLISKTLIWIGIVLVIVIIYALRSELSHIKHKVIAVLVPSRGVETASGEIIIARSSDGHFYVDATVNNVEIKFMIDTGASDIALSQIDARRLGFDITALNYNKIYHTASGTDAAAPVILKNFTIGNKLFTDIKGHIGSSGDLETSLLGMSLIERFKGFKIDGDFLTVITDK